MKNAAVGINRTLVITWEKSVNGLHEFMQLMRIMRKNSVINDFLNNHTLYGAEITHNSCYDLIIEKNTAYVYLKSNNVAAVA